MNWVSRQAVPPPLYLVPKPSVQPTLSPAFVEHFVEPCGFWPFSTKCAAKVHDKVHDKGPARLSWDKLYLSVVQLRRAASLEPHQSDWSTKDTLCCNLSVGPKSDMKDAVFTGVFLRPGGRYVCV